MQIFIFPPFSHSGYESKWLVYCRCFQFLLSVECLLIFFQRPNGRNFILIIITVIVISWLVFAISFNFQSANPPPRARTHTQRNEMKWSAKHDNVFHHNPISTFVCVCGARCVHVHVCINHSLFKWLWGYLFSIHCNLPTNKTNPNWQHLSSLLLLSFIRIVTTPSAVFPRCLLLWKRCSFVFSFRLFVWRFFTQVFIFWQ